MPNTTTVNINANEKPDKRLLPRLLLGKVPPGALTLINKGQRIQIDKLRDISNSGISFSLQQQLAVSERISIEYADAKVKIEVFGRVAWCQNTQTQPTAGAQKGQYLMGVELLSPMMLYAVLPKT